MILQTLAFLLAGKMVAAISLDQPSAADVSTTTVTTYWDSSFTSSATYYNANNVEPEVTVVIEEPYSTTTTTSYWGYSVTDTVTLKGDSVVTLLIEEPPLTTTTITTESLGSTTSTIIGETETVVVYNLP